MQRSTSTESIYYYIPQNRRNIFNRNPKFTIKESIQNNNQNKHIFIGLKGSSSFDYLNNISQIRPKFPKISSTFLTKNLRNKKSLENIEIKNMLQTMSINPVNKIRLSKNCELFHILNKTLMNNKNSLKKINNKELLGLNISEEQNDEKEEMFKRKTLTKFKNFYIKNSISKDINNDKNKNGLLSVKNINQKGMSEYYINFLYNQIFPKFFTEHQSKYNVVDNKLNIYYAENDAQFQDNLIKKNKRLRLRGKPEKRMIINRKYVTDKLMEIKRKIGFIKGVSDYSIPSIILQKVKYNNKKLQLKKGKSKVFLLPFEEINSEMKKIDNLKTKILSETIMINNKTQHIF